MGKEKERPLEYLANYYEYIKLVFMSPNSLSFWIVHSQTFYLKCSFFRFCLIASVFMQAKITGKRTTSPSGPQPLYNFAVSYLFYFPSFLRTDEMKKDSTYWQSFHAKKKELH
jgi:hypothetical protein